MTAPVRSILKLHDTVRASLARLRIDRLTRIQESAFVPVSAHRDVVIHAQCGAGKTLAYLLPLLNRRLYLCGRATPPVLVLQPSNVLCEQTVGVVSDLLGDSSAVRVQLLTETGRGSTGVIRSPRVHWGEADILVATPARYLADLSRNVPTPSTVVLDEADLLLQGASAVAVQQILEGFPGQTILSAATIPNALSMRISRRWSTAVWARDEAWHDMYAKTAVLLHSAVDSPSTKELQLASEVLPRVLDAMQNAEERNFRVLVFCETPGRATQVAQFLRERGWPAKSGSAGLAACVSRPTELEIACVTDGVGRGVDWRGVRAVVNFSAPGDVQSFLHRAGRLESVRGFPGGGRRHASVVVTMVETLAEKRRMDELQGELDKTESSKLHSLFSARRSLRSLRKRLSKSSSSSSS